MCRISVVYVLGLVLNEWLVEFYVGCVMLMLRRRGEKNLCCWFVCFIGVYIMCNVIQGNLGFKIYIYGDKFFGE